MVKSLLHCPTVYGSRVWVDESAKVIGDCVLNDDVSVWPMAVIRGDVAKITIGKRTNIQDGIKAVFDEMKKEYIDA